MKRKLTIGSEVKTEHGTFELVEKTKINSHSYLYKLKCKICGYEFTTKNINRCVCNICRKNKTINNYIGVKTNVYEILDFVETKNRTPYYKVKCLKCGKESIKNLKTIIAAKDNCEYCRQGNYKKPTIAAPINCVKGEYMRGAAERNLEWKLTDSEFENLIFSNCFYCGCKPKVYKSDNRFNKTGNLFLRVGIDRKDSSKGYTLENCVSCCDICNRMKMQMSENTFLNRIEQIYNYSVLKRSQTIPIGSTLQANGSGNGVYPKDNAEGKEIVESI